MPVGETAGWPAKRGAGDRIILVVEALARDQSQEHAAFADAGVHALLLGHQSSRQRSRPADYPSRITAVAAAVASVRDRRRRGAGLRRRQRRGCGGVAEALAGRGAARTAKRSSDVGSPTLSNMRATGAEGHQSQSGF